MSTTIEFTRVNNDVNGNPRYVCHFLNLLKDGEFDNLGTVNKDGSTMSADDVTRFVYGKSLISYKYEKALKRAKKIGGKKYHTKKYGGGIVFQSYNIKDTERYILEIVAKESA